MNSVELRDTEKVYAIVYELNKRLIDCGCIYGTFYGLSKEPDTGKPFHWNVTLSGRDIDHFSTEKNADRIMVGIANAFEARRNLRERTNYNVVSGSDSTAIP
jgi:hypothetical protein